MSSSSSCRWSAKYEGRIVADLYDRPECGFHMVRAVFTGSGLRLRLVFAFVGEPENRLHKSAEQLRGLGIPERSLIAARNQHDEYAALQLWVLKLNLPDPVALEFFTEPVCICA